MICEFTSEVQFTKDLKHCMQGWRQDLPDKGTKFPEGGRGAATPCPTKAMSCQKDDGLLSAQKYFDLFFAKNLKIWGVIKENLKKFRFSFQG